MSTTFKSVWKFVKFTEGRFVSVGVSARTFVAALLLGFKNTINLKVKVDILLSSGSSCQISRGGRCCRSSLGRLWLCWQEPHLKSYGRRASVATTSTIIFSGAVSSSKQESVFGRQFGRTSCGIWVSWSSVQCVTTSGASSAVVAIVMSSTYAQDSSSVVHPTPCFFISSSNSVMATLRASPECSPMGHFAPQPLDWSRCVGFHRLHRAVKGLESDRRIPAVKPSWGPSDCLQLRESVHLGEEVQ